MSLEYFTWQNRREGTVKSTYIIKDDRKVQNLSYCARAWVTLKYNLSLCLQTSWTFPGYEGQLRFIFAKSAHYNFKTLGVLRFCFFLGGGGGIFGRVSMPFMNFESLIWKFKDLSRTKQNPRIFPGFSGRVATLW